MVHVLNDFHMLANLTAIVHMAGRSLSMIVRDIFVHHAGLYFFSVRPKNTFTISFAYSSLTIRMRCSIAL